MEGGGAAGRGEGGGSAPSAVADAVAGQESAAASLPVVPTSVDVPLRPIPAGRGAEISLYLAGRVNGRASPRAVCARVDTACDHCMLLRLRGHVQTCMPLCDALRAGLADAALALEHAHLAALADDEHPTMPTLRDDDGGINSLQVRGEETSVLALPIDGAAPHGAARLSLTVSGGPRAADGGRGAGGTSTGPQPEEAPATIAARRLLGLVVRLRSAGLAVCALDVALVGASDKQGHGELQWNQLSCMQVALALRGRFASGAGHATAQEAQALDTAGWAAALRAAVDDVE